MDSDPCPLVVAKAFGHQRVETLPSARSLSLPKFCPRNSTFLVNIKLGHYNNLKASGKIDLSGCLFKLVPTIVIFPASLGFGNSSPCQKLNSGFINKLDTLQVRL